MSGKNGLPVRDPKDWVTGGDAPTAAQKGFLAKLVSDTGATDVDPENVNKSEASQHIDRLKNMGDSSNKTTTNDAPPPSSTTSAATTNPDKKSDETLQHPENWTTGGESATGKQAGYIKAMANKAGEDVTVEGMTKTEASEKIGELKKETGM